MERKKYTAKQASKMTGRGRSTIVRHMKSGKLSFEINHQGHRVVEASELIRVYGNDIDLSGEGKSDTARSESDESQFKFRALQEQYEARISDLKEALDKSDRALLLLENQSAEAGDWKQAIAEMKREVANERHAEISKLNEKHNKELVHLKRLLMEERQKSIWQKLFG